MFRQELTNRNALRFSSGLSHPHNGEICQCGAIDGHLALLVLPHHRQLDIRGLSLSYTYLVWLTSASLASAFEKPYLQQDTFVTIRNMYIFTYFVTARIVKPKFVNRKMHIKATNTIIGVREAILAYQGLRVHEKVARNHYYMPYLSATFCAIRN